MTMNPIPTKNHALWFTFALSELLPRNLPGITHVPAWWNGVVYRPGTLAAGGVAELHGRAEHQWATTLVFDIG